MVVYNNKVFIQCLEKLILCKHEVGETNMKCEDHYYVTYAREPDAIAFYPYRISPLGGPH